MCIAAELTLEERCTTEGSLGVWMKMYCKCVCDGCCNALKLGFEMCDLLSCFEDGSQLQDSPQQQRQGSLQLNNSAYTPLYVKHGVGRITETKGIKGDSKRLTEFDFCHAPLSSIAVVHQQLYKDAPHHPEWCYSRRPDVDMRVKLQNNQVACMMHLLPKWLKQVGTFHLAGRCIAS